MSDWLDGCRRRSDVNELPPTEMNMWPEVGLAAMEEAGDDVWQLSVRCRVGGGTKRLEPEAMVGTAQKGDACCRAGDATPLSSASLPLSDI